MQSMVDHSSAAVNALLIWTVAQVKSGNYGLHNRTCTDVSQKVLLYCCYDNKFSGLKHGHELEHAQ